MAYNLGYNVVQIFFEDNPKVIQRKHFTCWTEIPLNDLTEKKDDVKRVIEGFKERKGNLILKKMPSDGTTIPNIKQYLRKLISTGMKPDVIFLDYIDHGFTERVKDAVKFDRLCLHASFLSFKHPTTH